MKLISKSNFLNSKLNENASLDKTLYLIHLLSQNNGHFVITYGKLLHITVFIAHCDKLLLQIGNLLLKVRK